MIDIKPTAVPTGYSIARCRELRARCMEQARKRKDSGLKRDVIDWCGYALYWHCRVTHAGLSADAAQDLAHKRGAKWNVRSAAVQTATLKAVTMAHTPIDMPDSARSAALATFQKELDAESASGVPPMMLSATGAV